MVGHLSKGILDSGTIICRSQSTLVTHVKSQPRRTNLVQLDGVEFGTRLAEQLLSSLAVWAVGLAEDGCMVDSISLAHRRLGLTEYLFRRTRDLPTALSSMMPWAFVFAADMLSGLVARVKKARLKDLSMEEMMGETC